MAKPATGKRQDGPETKRERYLKRWAALKQERASWVEHWRELAEHEQPRRGRFLASEANKGGKRNDKIINFTPLKGVRILASGMMAGVTSPARKWFRLSVPAQMGQEISAPIRSWLNMVEERIFEVLARSNIYAALALVYKDLAVPGTTAMYVEEDVQDVVRAYVFPIGQYCLALSARLQVDTIYREFSMTVGQVVEKFGLTVCSRLVQDKFNQGKTEEWVQILHVIEPNPDSDPRYQDNGHMPYRSCWMELSSSDASDKFLKEGGYEEFPAMCPRWSVTGEDVYGHSPGMDALGDCKALQKYERESAKAVEKLVAPPLVGPTSLRNQKVSLIAGDVTYVDQMGAGQKLEALVTIHPAAIAAIDQKIATTAGRVLEAFYADLFLMLANDQRSDVTAEEIRAKQQEKMLALGPVLELLNDELLDPLIDRIFGIMLRAGLIPPPPEEVQDQPIKVEYTSILAQAQRLLGTTAVERLIHVVTNVAGAHPEALDKVDWDKLIDDYGKMLGISPDILNSPEVVAQIREARAQAQQAAQQGAAMAEAAKGAKDLSGASLEGDNALSRLMGSLGPNAVANAAPGGGVR